MHTRNSTSLTCVGLITEPRLCRKFEIGLHTQCAAEVLYPWISLPHLYIGISSMGRTPSDLLKTFPCSANFLDGCFDSESVTAGPRPDAPIVS